MTKLVFLDTETTGLSDNCDVWEIGLITRSDGGDVEYAWQLRPDLRNAEPTGLRIGRFYERIDPALLGYPRGHCRATAGPDADDFLVIERTKFIARDVARLLDGATIVGAVPDFDARHLTRWLRRYGQAGTWHYHLVDVETLAAGALRLAPPWDFDAMLAHYGLTYDEADRHTALGDARMVRDLYDRVIVGTDSHD